MMDSAELKRIVSACRDIRSEADDLVSNNIATNMDVNKIKSLSEEIEESIINMWLEEDFK
jgi:hypothetical protein